MATNTTLVINSKGGSGKTTVTTNLASYFASRQVPTTILDYDPQGSSLNWLSLRDRSGTKLYGANAAPQRGGRIRGIEMHVPVDTRQLLIDAPAGASGLLLQEMLSRANCIVIPVAPSAFDIYATANFVKDLLLVGRIRTRSIRLAVVANRVRSSAPVYRPLERFLGSLGLPFLTRISDSQVYGSSRWKSRPHRPSARNSCRSSIGWGESARLRCPRSEKSSTSRKRAGPRRTARRYSSRN
jgi:chromosome partitioning protein